MINPHTLYHKIHYFQCSKYLCNSFNEIIKIFETPIINYHGLKSIIYLMKCLNNQIEKTFKQ